MNTEEIKEKLNEYFEYIKTIYINEFSKYMTNETKSRILELNDIIVLNDDLSFKVSIKDKIIFNLNKKKYKEENKLKDESSLSDLNSDSKKYINYLIQNENNIYEILKNKLLEQIVIYFMNSKDVLTVGTSKIICERLKEKYKLPHEDIMPSKEKEVALFVNNIVGEDVLLSGTINNNVEIIEHKFNRYTEEYDFNSFIDELNKKYKEYRQKVGKIDLADSLYEYEKLDYKLDKKTKDIQRQKHDDSTSKLRRLSSIKMALLSISSHKILLNALEQNELDNALSEITKLMTKMISDKEKVANYIDIEYPRILELEADCRKMANKVWLNSLTTPNNYREKEEFKFLVSKNIDENIEASLLTSEMLKDIKEVPFNYGFICLPKEDSIISVSSSGITDEESTLITPNMIIGNNIKHNKIENKIVLSKDTYRVAVYCITDEDYENNPNYLRAQNLSDEYDLPIIKINNRDYYVDKNRSKVH